MTSWYDLDKLEKENRRLSDEVKNAVDIFRKYIGEHRYANNGNQCHCVNCQLAEAWLQRNR